MPILTMTSREFNHDTARAKKASRNGPVFITDRGRPAHVLLSVEDYEKLKGEPNFLESIAHWDGGDFDFDPPKLDFGLKPAEFD